MKWFESGILKNQGVVSGILATMSRIQRTWIPNRVWNSRCLIVALIPGYNSEVPGIGTSSKGVEFCMSGQKRPRNQQFIIPSIIQPIHQFLHRNALQMSSTISSSSHKYRCFITSTIFIFKRFRSSVLKSCIWYQKDSFIRYYPVNIRSDSTDIAGTENTSKAILVKVEYFFTLFFHHFKISNSSFVSGVPKNDNGTFK